jgi:peptidyl-prolyl cis-trans isomerase SDCCAG10
MSQAYSSDPTPSARAIIRSSVGIIEVELWTKESPVSSKRFIQTALEGKYDGSSFHRIVPGFLVQAGNPGIVDKRVEKHSRLRFSRRGIVALAGVGDQFFITLSGTPELLGKHSIIGRVGGDSLFNVLKIGEGQVEGEVPVNPVQIHRVDVVEHPFSELKNIVRKVQRSNDKVAEKKPKKVKVKNLSLLSFDAGEENGQEEDVVIQSSHDLLHGKDKRLSARTVIEVEEKKEEIVNEQQIERVLDETEEVETDQNVEHEKEEESLPKEKVTTQLKNVAVEDKSTQLDYESLKQELLSMKSKRIREELQNFNSKESILEQRRKKFLKDKPLDKSERQDIVNSLTFHIF